MENFKMPNVTQWQDESDKPASIFTPDEINRYRVTAEKYIPEPLPFIQIGKGTIATVCNLTVISAEAKQVRPD
jgi:hypothetical protein